MKKFRIISVALMAIICSTVSAQYYDEYGNWRENSYTRTSHSYDNEFEEGWCNFYVEYAPMNLVTTIKGAEDRLYHTGTIGFSYNYPLGNSFASLGLGIETSGSWFSERVDGVKTNLSFYHTKLPLNLSFVFPVADGLWIVPYGGINVKYNIYGEERTGNHTWKIFTDDYMYDNDYNRFQFGYQAGLKLVVANCISIGASWKADVTPFCSFYDDYTRKEEKERFKGFSFSLGYCF